MPAKSGGGKLLVVGLRCGRLGNRIVLFANLIAYAAEHGHRLINFTFHSYASFFETTRRDVFCQYPVPERQSWLDMVPGVAGVIRKTRIFYHVIRGVSVLNEKLPVFGKQVVTLRERPGQLIILLETPEVQAQIEEAKVVFVYGWIFRAPGAVQKHAEELRAYFRPTETYERVSAQAVAPLRRTRRLSSVFIFARGTIASGGRADASSRCHSTQPGCVSWPTSFPAKGCLSLCAATSRGARRSSRGCRLDLAQGSRWEILYALAKCDYILSNTEPETF